MPTGIRTSAGWERAPIATGTAEPPAARAAAPDEDLRLFAARPSSRTIVSTSVFHAPHERH
jgi:hypothetical protein